MLFDQSTEGSGVLRRSRRNQDCFSCDRFATTRQLSGSDTRVATKYQLLMVCEDALAVKPSKMSTSAQRFLEINDLPPLPQLPDLRDWLGGRPSIRHGSVHRCNALRGRLIGCLGGLLVVDIALYHESDDGQ